MQLLRQSLIQEDSVLRQIIIPGHNIAVSLHAAVLERDGVHPCGFDGNPFPPELLHRLPEGAGLILRLHLQSCPVQLRRLPV
ncbi:hypothetical protein D3C71_1940050 [compost metagenome]